MDVTVVREMYGLLAHHRAAAVKIVSVGDYTTDAQRVAQGKPIELIRGEALLTTVRECQASKSASHVQPQLSRQRCQNGAHINAKLSQMWRTNG